MFERTDNTYFETSAVKNLTVKSRDHVIHSIDWVLKFGPVLILDSFWLKLSRPLGDNLRTIRNICVANDQFAIKRTTSCDTVL